jgi:hypothetical protein
MADTRQMNTVLRGLASFEEGHVGLEQFRHIKQRFRNLAPDLGVPMTPERENALLRSFFINAEKGDA